VSTYFCFIFPSAPTIIQVRPLCHCTCHIRSRLPFCVRQCGHLRAVLIARNVAECKLGVRPQVYTDSGLLPVKQQCLPIARRVAVCKMNDPSPRAGNRVPRELKCLAGGPFSGMGDVATWITIRVGLVSAFGWCAGHGQSDDVERREILRYATEHEVARRTGKAVCFVGRRQIVALVSLFPNACAFRCEVWRCLCRGMLEHRPTSDVLQLLPWSYPITGVDGPWGFQEVDAPRFEDSQNMKVIRLSALRAGHHYLPPPPKGNIPIFLVLC